MARQQFGNAFGIRLLTAADAQFFGVNAAGDKQSVQSRHIRAVNIRNRGIAHNGDARFILHVKSRHAVFKNGRFGFSVPEHAAAHALILRGNRPRRQMSDAVF